MSSFTLLYCYPIKSLDDPTGQSMLTHTYYRLATCALKNSTYYLCAEEDTLTIRLGADAFSFSRRRYVRRKGPM